ncbi:MAG: hypothetical protein COA32_00925 [Fluviicola sp.]|nr:MAG: hypothetical protein COA32_00925 [Fluviicola sp.]
MHKITEDEIDFILDDIKANGVVIEDLQYNLLDHICCIIENEKSESEEFKEFYRKVVPRFFKKDFKEIQEETEVLLTFKNYYAMRNTLKIAGIASAILTVLGAILKTFHLPGAGIALIMGGILFSLVFLPLVIVLKFKDEESKTDKWVFSIGFLLAILITLGIIFKLMHWPYANIMMFSGLTTFVFGYVPLYFITRIRRPELRFNTIVNSVLMMACGGMLYALQDLGYSKKTTNDYSVYYNYIDESKASITNANLMLYKKMDTSKTEVVLLRNQTKSLDHLINEIKQSLDAKILRKNGEPKNNRLHRQKGVHFTKDGFYKSKDELSFNDLKSAVTDYNIFISKHGTKDRQIDIDVLSENEPIYNVLVDILNQIQLQIANNENALLNHWG